MRDRGVLGASADADRVLSPSATEPEVSAHSGDAPLRKSGGRAPYQKGYRLETSVRLYFQERGLECHRVALSGAGPEKGDICVTASWGDKLRIECKSRKKLAEWIVSALGEHDAVILKQDRGETYVLTRLTHYADLLQ